MKKNLVKISLVLLTMVTLITVGCKKKDEAEPTTTTTLPPAHPAGSVEGTITYNGTTTTVKGTSTSSSFGFVMSARNMNPPNSYPSVNIDFGTKPTKDSTYTISSNNFASVSTSSDSQNNQYFSTTGSIVVTKSGTAVTATFTNVTLHNTFTGDIIASATLTAY